MRKRLMEARADGFAGLRVVGGTTWTSSEDESSCRLLERGSADGGKKREEPGRLLDLAALPVERRLARLLLRLAQSMGRKTPHGVAIEVQLSGHDLAELVITSPYTVSRILAEWRRQNIINGRRERIVIRDQQRIASIAGVRPSGESSQLSQGGKL